MQPRAVLLLLLVKCSFCRRLRRPCAHCYYESYALYLRRTQETNYGSRIDYVLCSSRLLQSPQRPTHARAASAPFTADDPSHARTTTKLCGGALAGLLEADILPDVRRQPCPSQSNAFPLLKLLSEVPSLSQPHRCRRYKGRTIVQLSAQSRYLGRRCVRAV